MNRNPRKAGTRGLALVIDQRGELRFADGTPVLGWRDRQAAQTGRIARILRSPEHLLEASPSARLHYACNLPSAAQAASLREKCVLLPECLLGGDGFPKTEIERAGEPALAVLSFPGGSAPVVLEDGSLAAVRLRWLPLAADAEIGSIWRLYLTIDGPERGDPWRWTGTDYVFDAMGSPMPGEAHDQAHAENLGSGVRLLIMHGEDGLTQFPCTFGAVKVRELKADGWVRRTLLHAELMPGGDVFGVFSDGCHAPLGFAAPESQARPLAA
jgi:hypothetical protein